MTANTSVTGGGERRRGVLFDLDGVLIDSESVYTKFWEKIDSIYPTGIADFAHVIKGSTLTSILATFTDDDVRADIIERIHEFEHTMLYRAFPGVAELLEELRRRGIPAAIVTSSDDVKMRHLWEQLPWLRLYFDVIIDGSMVTRSKPDPQGYLLAAQAVGLPIEDCFVVEDSLPGLEAGQRSGATVIGIATTNPRRAVEAKAHYTVDTVGDLNVDTLLAM